MSRKVDWNSLLQELKKLPCDTRKIIATKIYLRGKYRYVKTKCSACKAVREINVDSIRVGTSRKCMCQRNRKYQDPRAFVLQERYSAMQQRCTNPNSQSWARYGGRGIQNRFKSPEHFVQYMLRHHPHPTYKGVEIDRENNNGHYEPGNIRLVSRYTNQHNKRSNVWIAYKGARLISSEAAAQLKRDYPSCTLHVLKVARYLCQGVSWQELTHRKGRGPYRKRKSTTS